MDIPFSCPVLETRRLNQTMSDRGKDQPSIGENNEPGPRFKEAFAQT